MKPAIFLDRDGVLTELVFRPATGGYEAPRSASELKLLDGFEDPIRRLRAAGYAIFIASNQPDAATGKCALENLQLVHKLMMAELNQRGVSLDGCYYCHHHPKGVVPELTKICDCRKPAPGMLFTAAREHSLDLAASWMIGDRDVDARCGIVAGCRSALLDYPFTSSQRSGLPNMPVFPDLSAAVEFILTNSPASK